MSRLNIFMQMNCSSQTPLRLTARFAAACMALSVMDPAIAQDSPVSAPAASTGLAAAAENTVIETEAATYSIKKIELHGTSLTNTDLAALLDPKSAIPIGDRLAKLSAAEVSIPEITITTKSVPVQNVTIHNIKLSDVQQGKAAAADVEGAHFAVTDEKSGNIEGDYGHLQAQVVNLALAARVMNEIRKDDSEPLNLVYGHLSVEGFKLKTSGKNVLTMMIGKITGDNVKARPFATRPPEVPAGNNDPTQLALFLKDVMTSEEMESMVASDIDLQSEADGQPVSIFLAKLSMMQFGSAKIADIDFGPLKIKAKGVSIDIGDIDFKGTDFQKLRDFSKKSTKEDTAPESDANQQALVFIPNISQFAVSKTAVSIADENGASTDIKSAFSIDHFEVDGDKPVETKPTQVTATLDHFILDLASLKDKDLKPLSDMGYTKLDLSSRIEMAWNPEAEELTVKDISVNGVNMGAVKIAGLIGNVTKDFFSGDSATMQAAALGAIVKKVEIRIDNAGLFEKAVAMQAKSQNKPIEEIKRSYVTTAAIGIPALLDNKPAAKIIGAALAKFFANPKSFHLVATSADGLGAADFALASQPSALLDTLEIKATANE